MAQFKRIEGIAAPLPIDNVDTDAIIPSRETQSVARSGYGEKLFANWRYAPGTRIVNPDFILNKPPFDGAAILVAGANFGCGSSREAAAWSLAQFGIRAIVAESFGAIFYNNCLRNGLLPVVLQREEIAILLRMIEQDRGTRSTAIDLEAKQVAMGDARFAFDIAPRDREMLLSGADEVELTLRGRPAIDAFRDRDTAERPWLYTNRRSTRG